MKPAPEAPRVQAPDPSKTKASSPILKPTAAAPETAPLLRPGAAQAADAETRAPIASTGRPRQRRPRDGRPDPPHNADAPQSGRTPFVVAVLASLVWIAVCGLYAYGRLWPAVASSSLEDVCFPSRDAPLPARDARPHLFIFASPRSPAGCSELRQSARAISQVAVQARRARNGRRRPCRDAVAGDPPRTDVDGRRVERALARASELETRVSAEVSTLERSYSDNERKIRSLIAEMADQREAIVASGARVRDAISNAHGGISGDLDSAGDRLSQKLNEAGQRLAGALGTTSEDIAISMDRAGSAAVERIAAKGAQISNSISGVGDTLADRLADTGRRTANDIVNRVSDIDDQVKAAGDLLLTGMDLRGVDLVGRINASQSVIVDAIGAHGERAATASRRRRARRAPPSAGIADDIVGRIAVFRARAPPTPSRARAISPPGGSPRPRRPRATIPSRASTRSSGRSGPAPRDAVEAIRAHGAGVAQRLTDAAGEARAAMGGHADELVERIASSTARAIEAVQDRQSELATQMMESSPVFGRLRGPGRRRRRAHQRRQRSGPRGDWLPFRRGRGQARRGLRPCADRRHRPRRCDCHAARI